MENRYGTEVFNQGIDRKVWGGISYEVFIPSPRFFKKSTRHIFKD